MHTLCCENVIQSRAGQYISCDMHAHLVSKAGSLISGKSPSPVSNGVAFHTRSRRSLTSDAISRSLSQMNRLRYEHDIASLVSDLLSVY